jgi:hypothetical protein
MNRKLVLALTLTLLIGLLNVTFDVQITKAIADSLSIDVSPIAGPPGTYPVSVFVHGATPDGELVRLRIYFNDASVYNITESSQYSSWGTFLRVPDVEPGEYTIKVLDAVSNTTAMAIFTVTPAPPPPEAGVKAGDWIKVDYAITGAPSGTPLPQWLKVEFLTVEGTNATVRVTMHMSDGTEQNATAPVDIVDGGGEAFGLSGFVIPANLTAGDIVYMSGYGNVTIAGETTRSYAGASRTVVYASLSQYGTQLTYYWDKQTGIIVEASTTSGSMTGTGKATETNMWQATPGFPIDPIMLSAPIAIVVVAVIALFLIRRRKKPIEAMKPETDRPE